MSGAKIGLKLSSFKNLEQIGRGGFGIVYSAQRENGEKVAIKKIDKTASQSRIKEEIKTMKKLKHRSIVEYYDHFVENGDTYLVIELCEGGSLLSYVKEKGPLDDSTAVHVLRQLISAVNYMHHFHVLHRDLSAGNVFIKDATKTKMTVKVGDFGLATNLELGGTACTIVGTPGFIAPQVFGQSYDQAADVFSLGAVLYTMLTAKNPPPKGPLNTDEIARHNKDAAELVNRMMHKDVRERIHLGEIVMTKFVSQNSDEEAKTYSRDSKRQRSREPIRSSRDGQSQDKRSHGRSLSQPVHSGSSNRPVYDRMPTTSSRDVASSENERGRHAAFGPSHEDPSHSHIWPIRMERLAGQRMRTAGGRYIVEMDTRCRFEVAAQGDVVRRILIVEWDQYRRIQNVYVHRISDRIERGRSEKDELIELTKSPLLYTGLSQLPKEVLNDYMRLQKMIVSNFKSRVAKIIFRRPSQFPDAHAQLMENGDLRIKLPKSVIVRKMDNGETYNCIDGLASKRENIHGTTLAKVNEVYTYLTRFEQCLNGMDRGMVCFPIIFSAGPDIASNYNNSPSSMTPSTSRASRFPFSNISSNQQSLAPHSAPFLNKPMSSRDASTAQRRVSTDENQAPTTVPSKYKLKLDLAKNVRSIQAADGRVVRISTSKADQFIFSDPAIRPDEQRFMRNGRVPERASEMLNTLLECIRKQQRL